MRANVVNLPDQANSVLGLGLDTGCDFPAGLAFEGIILLIIFLAFATEGEDDFTILPP